MRTAIIAGLFLAAAFSLGCQSSLPIVRQPEAAAMPVVRSGQGTVMPIAAADASATGSLRLMSTTSTSTTASWTKLLGAGDKPQHVALPRNDPRPDNRTADGTSDEF